MILSETIEIVYSNVVRNQIFSEDVPDYRRIEYTIRILEDGEPRITEEDETRLIE